MAPYLHFVGHEVDGVEPDAELSDHAQVRILRQRLHKVRRSGAGDGSQVGDEVGFRHAHSGVSDSQGPLVLQKSCHVNVE